MIAEETRNKIIMTARVCSYGGGGGAWAAVNSLPEMSPSKPSNNPQLYNLIRRVT